MPISISDLAFVYSGGSANRDPDQSLGGDPSSFPILQSINNLFPDVDPDEAANGYTDHRCFYVFNDSSTDALYDATVTIAEQVPDGSVAVLGFLVQDDEQAITVHGAAAGGTFILSYDSFPLTIPFTPDKDALATNVQNALNSLDRLGGVRCVGLDDNGAKTVVVHFEGQDGSRFHPLLVLVSDNIGGSTGVSIVKVIDGSPMNAVTALIGSPTVGPPGIVFGNPTAATMVGNLLPGDGFPVWVRRITPSNADGVRSDGFRLQVSGSPTSAPIVLPPPTWSYIGGGDLALSGVGGLIQRGPGEFVADTAGGVVLGDEAEYVAFFITQGPHGARRNYVVPTRGGVAVSGVAGNAIISHIHVTYLAGGAVGTGGDSDASTSGVDFVPLGGVYDCTEFPISWVVARMGVISTPEADRRCGCDFLNGASRLDFNPATNSWIGPFGPSQGDPYTYLSTYYIELKYDAAGQYWHLRSHSPYNPPGDMTDCSTLDASWRHDRWNCCGVNDRSNSEPYTERTDCILATFAFMVTPYSYCNAAPFQIDCGKCGRATKVPDTISLSTQFETGSTCEDSPFAGIFTLQRFAPKPCLWLGDVPGMPGLQWQMQYSVSHREWTIFLYDPSSFYSMFWSVPDEGFDCCTSTDGWVIDESQTFPCSPGSSAYAITVPVFPTGCQ